MQTGLRDLLDKRAKRSIAIILGVKERECDPHLPPGESAKMRKVVLDQINEFHDLVVDILDSLDTGEVVLNERYLAKIDQLHEVVVGNGKR